MSLADRIRTERQRLGLSQRELAKRAGMSGPGLSLLESGARGERAPRLRNLQGLAKALGLTVDELIAEPEADDSAAE